MTAGGLLIATTAIWVFSYPVGVWILGDAYGPRSRRSGRAVLHRLAGFAASIRIARGGWDRLETPSGGDGYRASGPSITHNNEAIARSHDGGL
jgi:hypothetical protein